MQTAGLRQSVLDRLVGAPDLEGVELDVSMDGRVVTLAGLVASHCRQIAAEDAVRRLAGECTIVNLTRIKPCVEVDGVRERIEDALCRSARNSADRLRIEVSGNRVLVAGRVHDQQERQTIRHAVATMPGVATVEDRLSVEKAPV